MINFGKFLTAVLALAFIACNNDDNGEYLPPETTPQALALNAHGTATGEPVVDFSLEGTSLQVTGNAFTMDFFDNFTGAKLGTVTDINVAAETFPDGSMKGENFTVFTFTDGKGTLVLHNFIDMVPLDPTTLNAFIPLADTKTNVIAGTGVFSGVEGGSTLNATLDMTEFAQGTVGFDCLYNIVLE